MVARIIRGTLEWACRNFNVCAGCEHDCRYCYAKSMAIRFQRSTPESWKDQIPLPEKLIEAGKGKPTRIMFPSTHDITPECLDICMDALDRMLKRGHTVLIVSKPHAQCITAICDRFGDYKDTLIFRFTIGSAANNVLKAWEPHAPQFEERLLSLEMAHAQGYQTSVSCEPMLDGAVERVVTAVLPFVSETVWIGVMNDVKQRLTLNGATPEVHRMGQDLVATCNRDMIKDLYSRLKENPKIRWKDSTRGMLGL